MCISSNYLLTNQVLSVMYSKKTQGRGQMCKQGRAKRHLQQQGEAVGYKPLQQIWAVGNKANTGLQNKPKSQPKI